MTKVTENEFRLMCEPERMLFLFRENNRRYTEALELVKTLKMTVDVFKERARRTEVQLELAAESMNAILDRVKDLEVDMNFAAKTLALVAENAVVSQDQLDALQDIVCIDEDTLGAVSQRVDVLNKEVRNNALGLNL
jgi:repressor of nif and glnA expression